MLQTLGDPELRGHVQQLVDRTIFDGPAYLVSISNKSGSTVHAEAVRASGLLILVSEDSESKTYKWDVAIEEHYASVCSFPMEHSPGT
jgi:hypothetical protein